MRERTNAVFRFDVLGLRLLILLGTQFVPLFGSPGNSPPLWPPANINPKPGSANSD